MSSIHAESFLPFPPSRVWQALTDSEMIGKWLMKTDFVPVVGHAFRFDTGNWGITHCEVLAMEPEKMLRYSWKNPPLDTVVTFTLTPEGEGTRLTLEHSGFHLEDPRQKFAYEGMKGGWEAMLQSRIAAVLA